MVSILLSLRSHNSRQNDLRSEIPNPTTRIIRPHRTGVKRILLSLQSLQLRIESIPNRLSNRQRIRSMIVDLDDLPLARRVSTRYDL
jgi:hypothetical protein